MLMTPWPELLKLAGIRLTPGFVGCSLIASPFFLGRDWSPRLIATAVLYFGFGNAAFLPLGLCVAWASLTESRRRLIEIRDDHHRARETARQERILEEDRKLRAEQQRVAAQQRMAARQQAQASAQAESSPPTAEQVRDAKLAAAEAKLKVALRHWKSEFVVESVPEPERAYAVNEALRRHREEVEEILME